MLSGLEQRCEVPQLPPLLLTFFGAGVFLNDEAIFPGFYLPSRFFHQPGKAASQFIDTMRLAFGNGFRGNQFRTHTNGGSPRENIAGRRLLIDAARGD